MKMAQSPPGYLVFRLSDDRWGLVGEANRRPGRTAKAARRDAIVAVIGREPDPAERYAAVLRSEWRIGTEY
jgi:hypothetical protein